MVDQAGIGVLVELQPDVVAGNRAERIGQILGIEAGLNRGVMASSWVLVKVRFIVASG